MKRYMYSGFLEDYRLHQDFITEYSILKQAREIKLKHVISLNNILLGVDHAAITMQKLEMDLRTYLRKYRDFRQLNRILGMVAEGMKELHSIGYVHRDLKPENIVLNLKPLDVKIIDFNRAIPMSVTTKGHVRGTEGYFPENENIRDGSTKWDIWALAVIILEADMEIDEYFSVKDERSSKRKVFEHFNREQTCKHLKVLLRRTLLVPKIEEMMSYDDLIAELT